MSEDIEINGFKIDLPGNRYVWVGRHEGTAMIEFQNSEGEKTRVRLSKEAAEALRYLLGEPDKADDMVKAFIMHMTAAVEEQQPAFRWQVVKPDTLPVAAP